MSSSTLYADPLTPVPDPIANLISELVAQTARGYPPYDITQIAADRLRITLAVAGFNIDDLSVSILGRRVMVRGRRPAAATSEHAILLHRGIALRQFQRSFAIADAVEVSGAALDRGLLSIDLKVKAAQAPVRVTVMEPEGTELGCAHQAARRLGATLEGE